MEKNVSISPLDSNKTPLKPDAEVKLSPLETKAKETVKVFNTAITQQEAPGQTAKLSEEHSIKPDSTQSQEKSLLEESHISQSTGNIETFNSDTTKESGWFSWLYDQAASVVNATIEFVETMHQPHIPEEEKVEDLKTAEEDEESVRYISDDEDDEEFFDAEEGPPSLETKSEEVVVSSQVKEVETKPEEKSLFDSLCDSVSKVSGTLVSFGQTAVEYAQSGGEKVREGIQTSVEYLSESAQTAIDFTNEKVMDIVHIVNENVVQPVVAKVAETGIVAKIVQTGTNVVISSLSSLNKIDTAKTKEKLKDATGSDIPHSAIDAFTTFGFMKKMSTLSTSAKDVAIKTALEHPYVHDVMLEVMSTATEGMYKKLGDLQGDQMANLAISILEDINSTEEVATVALSEEDKAKLIKERNEKTAEILMSILLPKGIDSLPLSKEACEKLDGISDTYNSFYAHLTGSEVELLNLRKEMYDLVKQRVMSMAETMNKTISDPVFQKEVTVSILKDLHREVGSGVVPGSENPPKYVSQIANTEKKYEPSTAIKKEMSNQLKTFTLNTLKDVTTPGQYKALTNKHLGPLRDSGYIMNYLTDKVGSLILTKLGSIDLKQTATNMLKRGAEVKIPEGTWEGEKFTFDKDTIQKRIESSKDASVEQKVALDQNEKIKNLDSTIEELTNDESIKKFLKGAVKTGHKLLGDKFSTYFESSKIIVPTLRRWITKAASKVTTYFVNKFPNILEKLATTDLYKKSKGKLKNLAKKIPDVASEKSSTLTLPQEIQHLKKRKSNFH